MNATPKISYAAIPGQSGNLPAPTEKVSRTVDKNKLKKAALDFESILLASWLQGMQEMVKSLAGSEGDQMDPGADTLAAWGTQAISKALAERGGVGIARMLTRHFAPEARVNEKQPAKAESQESLKNF